MSDDLDKLSERIESLEIKHSPPPKVDERKGGSVAIEFGAAIIISLLIGSWLDKQFDTSPWLFLVFLTLGFMTAFYNLQRASTGLSAKTLDSELHPDSKDGKTSHKSNESSKENG